MSTISQDEWAEIKRLSRPISSKLSGTGWWNNKPYKNNQDQNENGGCKEQISKWGEREIPYNREIFKPSRTRFGLGETSLAYFSNDYALNCCEVIDQFRNSEDLPWSELKKFLNGRTNPTPDLMWYPVSVKIFRDALILELMDDSLPFLEIFARKGGWASKSELSREVILRRDPSVYGETQEISKAALANGFPGICYQSVRSPSDINLPDRNLVVFDKSIIMREYC
jgi:hypothetical protein